jgi:hypothetical protein
LADVLEVDLLSAKIADRASGSDRHRDQLRGKTITPHIACRGNDMARAWGHTAGWWNKGPRCLHWFRRLRTRWEIRNDIHGAFLRLACSVICFRRLLNLQLSTVIRKLVCANSDDWS